MNHINHIRATSRLLLLKSLLNLTANICQKRLSDRFFRFIFLVVPRRAALFLIILFPRYWVRRRFANGYP